ncbi:Na-translocating system protein MpsC family protein [Virgibacillus pantothenticus]|uniref:Na-translocating system protein MpsC family protein n=1 Tax=Virgibacillus pantothenticus TaxID=1473 RepID=UPI0009867242|nr:Na-translocating system protein MpsC family protein [Virgibacillus pantothenticus]
MKTKVKSTEASIASATGKLLRSYFGKGPGALYVSLAHSYLTIYLKDFITPMESVLLEQKQNIKIEQARDVVMNKCIPELKRIWQNEFGITVQQLYYDWNLTNKSGILFAEIKATHIMNNSSSLSNEERTGIHQEIERFTEKAQKAPRNIKSVRLNERTIVSKREDILVTIEKELISSGFEEELRLSKRKLEKNIMDREYLESILNQQMEDIFVDWDFHHDIGYVVMILQAV